MYIAREGWLHLLIISVISVAATLMLGWWSLPVWVLWIFVLQFFRDPVPVIPTGDDQHSDLVVSPADGKIVALMQANDPYQQRPSLMISVFMNVFSVHSNRCPVGGTIKKRTYHKGRFFNAALDKASSENERNAVVIETDYGVKVTAVQIAGLVARRILCYINEGDSVRTGQRYGFIRFGSRVDVYLPENAVARVSLGEKVLSGSSILAELNTS